MFFDPDDMEKFADEGTMDDDLEGELRVRDESCEGISSIVIACRCEAHRFCVFGRTIEWCRAVQGIAHVASQPLLWGRFGPHA